MSSKPTIRQLHEALEYAENIISTVREPLLVLDAGLHIITANQSFYHLFSTTTLETEGKLVYEVDNGQWDIPELRNLLDNILQKNSTFENFEVDHNFPRLGRRTMILNARRIHDGSPRSDKILLAIEDITERRRAEHDIGSSELRYRRLFETAQDGILILNSQTGEITDVNPFLTAMLGYSKQELSGKKLWEIGFFKDSAASHEAFRILQEKGYVRYEDLPLETKDGRPMEVEFVSNVYRIDGEEIIQCNIRDITERKRVENNLEKSRLRMSNILNSISDGFFSLDSNFIVTYFNPAAQQLLGKQASDVLGHNMFTEAFPEARGSVFEENYSRVMKENKPLFFETYFGVKPYENWYDVRAFPSENGVVVFFQVTTERKKAEIALRESEERFREMFESHQSIMLLIEPESGRIIDSNPAAAVFYGYRRDVLNTMNIGDINQLPAAEIARERQKAVKKQTKQFIFPHRLANGEIRMVEVNSSPIKVNDQPILFSIIRDVSIREKALQEIKILNESLKEHTAELEIANQELDAFSYTASHDLQAPLRAMNGFSKALLEDYADKLDEQGKDYLRRIGESSQRMSQMINAMLNLSRLGKNEIQREPVNLSELAVFTTQELRHSDPSRQIEFEITPGLIANGDNKLLHIVIENLLGNAWKFTSRKQGAKITFGMTEKNGKRAYYVQDNGVGFNMTYAEQLFKPFQRFHSAAEFPGTGIGLASIQRIIKRHGGKVWAEAETGKGATFYFTLD